MDTASHEIAPIRTGPPVPVNAKGQRICGAPTRNTRSGMPTCQSRALGPENSKGNRRCRMHGGFPTTGAMAPQATQGGRYSRHLPKRLQGVFRAAQSDPAVLSLREDVALLTARIELTLDGLDGGDSIATAREAWAAYEAAVSTRDPMRITLAADAMRAAMARIGDQEVALREIERLQLIKAKLAVAESKRQLAAATMLDAASAWALVSAIGELIKTHVSDPTARRSVAEGLVRLTHRGTLPRPE